MSYSLNGQNILFENPSSAGKTLHNSNTGFWMGGYQCDIGPEIRGLPEHPLLWIGPYRWEIPRDYQVRMTSEWDPAIRVQLSKELLFDPESGEVGLTQILKNISDRPVSYCLWDRTLCRGGGFAFFPLSKTSRFPARWSLRRTIDNKYNYDGVSPESSKVRILDGVLVAECRGEPTKLGADSDAGWIAYVLGSQLLVKYFPYYKKGNYSDGGNSVELYWDQQVAELEPLSPEIALRPEEDYSFPEKWVLTSLKNEVKTFQQARALVAKIRPSPFK
jgi:hypothetical protein